MLDGLEKAGVESVATVAETPGVRECLQWFSRERNWISEQHARVVRIGAPTFFEQARAEWMATQFRTLGCEVRTDGAGNLIALPSKMPDPRRVVVSAHLDTVLAPRSPEEIIREPDGTLRGPGVADNGAGLAALLALAGAIHAAPALGDLQCGVLLLANVCEEGEGNLSGMRHFSEDSRMGAEARAFLVLDGPATDYITCEALESRRFEITFSGPGGHSWHDFGVGNPVHALCRALAQFLERYLEIKSVTGARSSFNFGRIEGGTSVNSIPSSARAKVDLRSEDGRMVEELSALLAASMEKGAEVENARASSGQVTARIRMIGSRPGGRLAEDAPILNFLRAVDSHLGITSRPERASTDANIPLSKGLQAVSIGAGGQGGGAHTASEWFHPRDRALGLERIFLTLVLLMRTAGLAWGRG